MPSVLWEQKAIEALIGLAREDHRQAARVSEGNYRFLESQRGAIKLKGYKDRWRIRIGDWRVVIRRIGRDIEVIEVVLRRDAYDRD